MIALNCPCDNLPTLLPNESVGQRVYCPHSGAPFVVLGGQPFGEEEWRACERPSFLLRYLEEREYQLSGRKRRLLACAVCRLAWGRLPDDQCRRAVAHI